jgi:hypothetical protein
MLPSSYAGGVAAGSAPESSIAIPATIAITAMAIQSFFIAKLTGNLLLCPQPASLLPCLGKSTGVNRIFFGVACRYVQA